MYIHVVCCHGVGRGATPLTTPLRRHNEKGSESMRLEHRWQIAIAVTIGLFMAVLDTSIVNVALPQMQQAFRTDFATIIWVATAYFLAQAAAIPGAGYLS